MSALSAIGPCSNPTVGEILQQSNEAHFADKARAGVPEDVPRVVEVAADNGSPFASALSTSLRAVQSTLVDLAASK